MPHYKNMSNTGLIFSPVKYAYYKFLVSIENNKKINKHLSSCMVDTSISLEEFKLNF